jgi:hypothetical protein
MGVLVEIMTICGGTTIEIALFFVMVSILIVAVDAIFTRSSVGRVSLVVHRVRARIRAGHLGISTSRHSSSNTRGHRCRRNGILVERTLGLIPDPGQIIHFHLLMLCMGILHPSCLRISPRRHWRELVFVDNSRFARLIKGRGLRRAAVCWRRRG